MLIYTSRKRSQFIYLQEVNELYKILGLIILRFSSILEYRQTRHKVISQKARPCISQTILFRNTVTSTCFFINRLSCGKSHEEQFHEVDVFASHSSKNSCKLHSTVLKKRREHWWMIGMTDQEQRDVFYETLNIIHLSHQASKIVTATTEQANDRNTFWDKHYIAHSVTNLTIHYIKYTTITLLIVLEYPRHLQSKELIENFV